MASGNISRYKNLGSYLSNINARLAQSERARSAYGGIAAGAITSNHLAGQVILDDNVIQSANYAKGVSGWSIDANGSAEFSDVFVRGNINADSGTIGVWNLSAQETARTFDVETYFASNAVSNTDGTVTYTTTINHSLVVGDFVTITGIASLDNTSATAGSGFNLINAEVISLTANTFTVSASSTDTYSSGTGLVSKVYAGTYIENVDLGFDDSNATTGTYVGLYTSQNLLTSGLYLRDYAKRYLDYAYFSSNGVAYTSAAVLNLVWNPSAEYYTSGAISNTVTGWATTSVNTVPTYDFSLSGTISGSSSYAIEAAWDTTARTDYTTATIDYQAGNDYSLFNRTKPLYLSFDFSPFYVPVFSSATDVVYYSNTLLKVTTTNTLSAGDSVYVDFTVSSDYSGDIAIKAGDVTTVASSPAPNTSVIYLNIPSAYAPNWNANANFDSSTVAKTFAITNTSTAFALAGYGDAFNNGQGVQVVVPSGTLAGTYYGTVGAWTATSITITWITKPSANGTFPIGTTISGHPVSRTSIRTPATYNIYKSFDLYLNPSEIQFQFDSSNASAVTSLSNVVSSGVSFSDPTQFYVNGAAYVGAYVGGDQFPIKRFSVSIDPTKLDAAYNNLAPNAYANANTITLNVPNWLYRDSAYTTKFVKSSLDYKTSAISAVVSNTLGTTYTVSNPYVVGQIVSISGIGSSPANAFNLKDVQVSSITGTPGSATAFTVNVKNISGTFNSGAASSSVGRVGYILDNVSLSPENNFFYGSSGLGSTSSSYSWYSLGSGTTAPAQASIQAPKSWINVDLLGQTSSLGYWDYIGFKTKSTGYSGTLFANPAISTAPNYSTLNFYSNSILGNKPGYIITANSSSVLNISSGAIQWNTGGTTFENHESYINSVTSKYASGVELVAKNTVTVGGVANTSLSSVASASVYVDDWYGDSGAVSNGGAGVFKLWLICLELWILTIIQLFMVVTTILLVMSITPLRPLRF